MNPFADTENVHQQLSWKHFSNKGEYHLELICPLQGLTTTYRGEGKYWLMAAEVIESAETNTSGIFKGELIIVEFPMSTFKSSWVAVSHIFRKDFQRNNANNLRIKFTKKHRTSMFIHTVDKTIPTTEQQEFANKVYTGEIVYHRESVKPSEPKIVNSEEVY